MAGVDRNGAIHDQKGRYSEKNSGRPSGDADLPDDTTTPTASTASEPVEDHETWLEEAREAAYNNELNETDARRLLADPDDDNASPALFTDQATPEDADRLSHSPSMGARVDAIQSGLLDYDRLRELTHDPEPWVRRHAIEEAQLDPRDLARFTLTDPDREVREEAFDQLFDNPHRECLPQAKQLFGRLTDRSPDPTRGTDLDGFLTRVRAAAPRNWNRETTKQVTFRFAEWWLQTHELRRQLSNEVDRDRSRQSLTTSLNRIPSRLVSDRTDDKAVIHPVKGNPITFTVQDGWIHVQRDQDQGGDTTIDMLQPDGEQQLDQIIHDGLRQ